MTIKIKSILDKKSDDDGLRICVMRFVKPHHEYDKWVRELAPSAVLLRDYRAETIDWNEFEKRYLEEMKGRKELIADFRRRSDRGDTITLLCWEKDDRFCHRSLLRNCILEEANPQINTD